MKTKTVIVLAIAFGAQVCCLAHLSDPSDADPSVVGYRIAQAPQKLEYIEWETFDPAGLVLTVIYDDGTETDVPYAGSEDLFHFVPSLETELTTDITDVRISLEGEHSADPCEQAIKVTEQKLDRILEVSAPVTEFAVHDPFNPEGVTLKVLFNNGHTTVVAFNPLSPEFSIVPAPGQELLDQKSAEVTYTYNGDSRSISYDILVRCHISFDANGAIGGQMADQLVEYGVDQTLLPNAFNYLGHTFVGWNTAPDGSGTQYGNGGTITADDNVTLYAQWRNGGMNDSQTFLIMTVIGVLVVLAFVLYRAKRVQGRKG